MSECVRAGCRGEALATWWQLCTNCTLPLLERAESPQDPIVDQRHAAGWEAIDWAERISPHRWGQAVESDRWVSSVRCLGFASVASGRSQGCPHTATPSPVPVIVIPRAVDHLACPSCAEPVVARHTVDGVTCDRCRRSTVGSADRVAAVAGSSLIIVAQLCTGCLDAVLVLSNSAWGSADAD